MEHRIFAKELLDRGFGKATQQLECAGNLEYPIVIGDVGIIKGYGSPMEPEALNPRCLHDGTTRPVA